MNKITHYFIIGTFVSLYVIVSLISTIHVINFFELSNPRWLAISLAVSFEIGAAASLSSIIIMDRMNKYLVWSLFIILTAMQAMGNTYYAYTNLHDFQMWSELFGISEEEVIYQKRVLSIISGAILPLVSLGFIKSLVDYINPINNKKIEVVEKKEEHEDKTVEVENKVEVSEEKPEDVQVKEDIGDIIEKIEESREKKSEISNDSWAPEDIEPIITESKDNKKIEDPVLAYRNRLK